MTRYGRTVFFNRRACEALAKERRAREAELVGVVPEPLTLFEWRGASGAADPDFDRYQLAFARAETENEKP